MAASRPMFCACGDDSVIKAIVEKLKHEVETLEIARSVLPSWLNDGIDDYSCAIHSLGCTYFTSLGRDFGYQAVAEYPCPHVGEMAFVGSDVRCDSAWFRPHEFEMIAAVEFERYEGLSDAADLMRKVQSLSLAYHRSVSKPLIAILAYWTRKSAMLPDHNSLRRVFSRGFETPEKQRVPGVPDCRLLIYQLVHEQDARTGKWKLWKMIERGNK